MLFTSVSGKSDGYFFLFQNYLTHMGFADNTIRNYLADLRTFVRWFKKTHQKEFSPLELSHSHLREFALSLLEEGKSYATVRRKLTGVRAFLLWARRAGRASEFPALPRLKPVSPPSGRILSAQEEEMLVRTVAATASSRDQVIIFLILEAGLALEELLGLRLDDVRLSREGVTLTVRRKNQRRTVRLGPRAEASLRTYLTERRAVSNRRLFVGRKGPLGPRAIQHLLARYACRCGLDGKVNASTLRRTFVARALESGEDPASVAERMGISERSLKALMEVRLKR